MPDLHELLNEDLRRPENSTGPAAFMSGPSNEGAAGSTNKNTADRKGVEIPSITLPQGGGAIRSIDEKFKVNPVNGTASFSIPLPLSPGRSGATPAIGLSYNSGSGNSEFGVGWGLDHPCIMRRTERMLPRYRDAGDEDVFILSGSEDLVPVEGIPGRYRPRIESGFMQIERIGQGGGMYWVVRSGENMVFVYGQSEGARLADPSAPSERIFKWCLEYSYDDKGNFVKYVYKKEDTVNVAASVWDKNRLSGLASFTNLYLKSVHYGNAVAWHPGDPTPVDFYFSLVLDYGDEGASWPVRSDVFSHFRAGFEIRTYRLCRRALVYHHFAAELGSANVLVRSLDFAYDEQPHLSYLRSITETGYMPGSALSLPPLEFEYFKPGFSNEVRELSPDDIVNAPTGLDDPMYQFTDLYSEGIAGILSEQAGGWFYKSNLGNGRFSPASLLGARPSLTGLEEGVLSLQDLDGDGRKYLVSMQDAVRGYFAVSAGDDPGFEPGVFGSFDAMPNIDWHDPTLKYIDLNGDGMPDLLLTSDPDLIWYAAKGTLGYDDYERSLLAPDEERGPRVLFANKDERISIVTADMTGDGMSDLVIVSYDSVYYYPNLGYGRFGARVTMQLDEAFDELSAFDPAFLVFGDIDGSGTTDIVYAGSGAIRVWFNQSGNRFSSASSFFNPFPAIDRSSRLRLVDLLGTGLSCLVWSSSLAQPADAPLRYIDLMNGRKPHLMSGYRNNLGKEVSLSYRASTQYYLDDKLRGMVWVTRLPFAVQCVNKTVVIDKVAQTRFTNEYSYHHGYYDAKEREFRGFAMVEQKDSEEYDHFVAGDGGSPIEADLFQTPVLTRSWFHTGAWLRREQVLHQLQQEYFADDLPLLDGRSVLPSGLSDGAFSECCRALKGLPLRTEVYGLDLPSVPFSVVQHSYDLVQLQGGSRPVFFPREKEVLTFQYERVAPDPRIAHVMNLLFDEFGNVLESVSIAYGRSQADAALPTDADRAQQGKTLIQFTRRVFSGALDAAGVWRLPVVCETGLYELPAVAPAGRIYAVGEIDVTDASMLVAQQRVLFSRDDLSGPLPFGVQGSLGLPYETYTLGYTPATAMAIFGDKYEEAVWRAADFVSLDNDGNYWIPSGRAQYDAAKFYLPVRFEDGFGNPTTVDYDVYHLMIREIADPAGNTSTAALLNYRVMSPVLMRDANGNGQGVRYDALGRPVAHFMMGKVSESLGDVMDLTAVEASAMDQPGKTLGYELRYFVSGGLLPDRVLVREREHHTSDARWLASYSYSDGSAHTVFSKVEAEADVSGASRWIGRGFAIYNNKGNVVKSYEPFFDSDPEYQRGSTIASVNYYDALGRLVKSVLPDGSFSEVRFNAWTIASYDRNDTVLDSDWYAARANGQLGADQQLAAQRTAVHAGTPVVKYLDGLARSFIKESMNVTQRSDEAPVSETFFMRSVYDIAGNVLRVTDERNNVAMSYGYDLLNGMVYSHSMDSGDRWLLKDIGGMGVRIWDSRGQVFDHTYDMLRRPLTAVVTKGGSSIMYAKMEYGERVADADSMNLRGKLYRQYDTAGLLVIGSYDFKGNISDTSRTLVSDHVATPDWSGSPVMEAESFTESKTYDALNRLVSMVAADASVVLLSYDESRMLDRVDVRLQGGAVVTPFVTQIHHDAMGQREQIVYGNDSAARYDHDPQTYRLTRLLTTAGSGARILQDLNYVYDPVGNIVSVADNAQKTVFYGGQSVAAQSGYIYDALYRLVEASGREHSGQVLSNPTDNWNDSWSIVALQPNSPLALRNYRQKYSYDGVGNILSMQHIAGGSAGWTRTYAYDTGSNRLLQTASSAQGYSYGYDEHGSMISMPHLPVIDWDCMQRMQHVRLPAGDAYYVYDGKGQRVRKVVVGADGSLSERIYIGGLEIYRESRGGVVTLERTSLHVMDDLQRIAMVDTLTAGGDSGVTPGGVGSQLIRYQYSDHLGSAALELDGAGLVISYEEYHPYGTTAFQATDASRQVPAKRYRYTGMERDEETGLGYHVARYYAPWVGRWTAADPIGIAGGTNVYAYGKGNPIVFSDVSGLSPNRSECEDSSMGKPAPAKKPPPQKKETFIELDVGLIERFPPDMSTPLARAQANRTGKLPKDVKINEKIGTVQKVRTDRRTELTIDFLPDRESVGPEKQSPNIGLTISTVRSIDPPSVDLLQTRQGDTVTSSYVLREKTPARINLSIRVSYSRGLDPERDGAYGKGTRPEDIAAGNTSIRWHESEHVKDIQDYIDAHPLPQFRAYPGMTEEEYYRAADAFKDEVDRWYKNIQHYTQVETEEAGEHPQAQFIKEHPGWRESIRYDFPD